MSKALMIVASAGLALMFASPALAGHHPGGGSSGGWGGSSGGWGGSSGGSTGSSGGSTGSSGGSTTSSSGGSTSSGGPTSVPEPADAVLLLLGAGGVVIGRRLHARAKKDD